jgi:hypothetical protein
LPPIQYWFTGAALGAALALFFAIITLGFAWYRAADTEMQTASGKAKTRADTQKLIEARERLGKFLEEGIELLKATQQEQRPPPIDAVKNGIKQWCPTLVPQWANLS